MKTNSTIEEIVTLSKLGSEHAVRLLCDKLTGNAVLLKAINAIIDASNEYLPPDGISKDDFINCVLGATDNVEVFKALKEMHQ